MDGLWKFIKLYPCVLTSLEAYLCCYFVAKSCLTLVTPWTEAHQAPLSMGFPRQEYWSALLFPSPGDLPDQGSNLSVLYWQVDSLWLSHQENSRYLCCILIESKKVRTW